MNDFLLVLLIATIAGFLTYLGAPLAERFDVPHVVVSAALQFAAGVVAALVAFSLMPPAVRLSPPLATVLAFFIGGALYVFFERFAAGAPATESPDGEAAISLGLYAGILVDLLIDGMVIGVGSTLSLGTGILLALGMAISTLPLAFVTIATAKRQGMPASKRQLLGFLFFGCIIFGAIVGYGLLRNQPDSIRLILIALASGFLITLVTQGLIPEANREGEPGFAGILFIAGLSMYALLTLTVK